MKYLVHRKCYDNIERFYKNVAKKYKHTYSRQLMRQNIDDAIDGIFEIEHTLPRLKPTMARWTKYHMANTERWYYAYTIEGDTINVVDSCHAQNMHEEIAQEDNPEA